MRRSSLCVLAIPLLSACGAAPPRPPPAARCGATREADRFPAGPGLRVVVAGLPADFAGRFERAAAEESARFERESRAEQALTGVAPDEAILRIEQLSCAVANHDEAHALAGALGADLVLWGGASSAPGERVSPNLTLHYLFHDVAHPGPLLRARTDLALPPLRPDDPLPLVYFLMGLSFQERGRNPARSGEWRFAARFHRWAVDGVEPSAPHREIFELEVAVAAMRIGDVAGGANLCQSRLDRGNVAGTHVEAILLGCVADGLDAKGDREGALAMHRRERELGERLHDAIVVGSASASIGQLLLDRGEAAAAVPELERALSAFAEATGPDSSVAGMAEDLLARAYTALRDSAHAVEHGRRALALAEKAWGAEHEALAPLAFALGSALLDQGDATGALAQARRATAVLVHARAAASKVGGLVELLTANALHKLGERAQAEEHYRTALSILVQALGPDHPHVAAVELDFGRLLHEKGDQEGSLQHLLRALSIQERLFGQESEKILDALLAVASVRFRQGDLYGAHQLLFRARPIAEQHLGDLHPTTLRIMADTGAVLLDQGRYPSALNHCRYAAQNLLLTVGLDDPRTRAAVTCAAYAAAVPSGWKPGAPGALVHHRKSPRAGPLAPGDWIKTYEGKPVRDAAHLLQLSAATEGRAALVHLVVVRDKKQIRIPADSGLLDAELLDTSALSAPGR